MSLDEDVDEAEEEDDDHNADDDGPASTATVERFSEAKAANQRLGKKQQKKVRPVERARFAEKGRRKEVKLNKLSAISGMGGSAAKLGTAKGDRECYQCHKRGHEARECPQGGRRKHESRSSGSSKQSKLLLDY